MQASKIAGRAMGLAAAVLIAGIPARPAFPHSDILRKLSAEWVQWALSVPAPVNPMLDETGANCTVGQRGNTWLLAGGFDSSSSSYSRTCTVPQGKAIFLPIANSFQFNSPGVCGSVEQSAAELSRAAAGIVAGVTEIEVLLDGAPVRSVRLRSPVFEVSLPEDNVFDALCTPENVPGGVYSPAVADGYYLRLPPLSIGLHTLRIRTEGSIHQDVSYSLNSVLLDAD